MTTDSLDRKPAVEPVATGITKQDSKEIADALCDALADSFSLYLKTLGVHWNIVGASFYGLHKLTEAQYADLDAAIDEMAERIRALGYIAPASFSDFAKRSVIESESTIASADDMLMALIKDNEAIAKRLRKAVKVAESADDVFTADFLTARIGMHEKNIWMLKASAA